MVNAGFEIRNASADDAVTKSVYTRQGSFVLFLYTNDYTSDGVITPPISSSENHGILLSQGYGENKCNQQR